MKETVYLITPFLAWLVTGITKFLFNSFKAQRLAFDLIGYGGMPSNHSAIVFSSATLIALIEGIDHPAFGVAVTLAFIVMLDATSLRQKIGLQASAINEIDSRFKLRERMGHTKLEITVGGLTGSLCALLVYFALYA